MHRRLWLVPALSLSLAGCVGTYGSPDGVSVVRGTLGEVDFVGVPELRELRVRPDELHLDLRIAGPRGAAMVGVTIPRERLEDGTFALRAEEAELVGCSGAEDGEWEFDCHPTEWFVELYEGKDELHVDFEGTFTGEGCGDLPADAPDEGQSIDGSIDVDLI